MNQTKIELLAPAGDFACFQAAMNAGADAVYLGGDKLEQEPMHIISRKKKL